MDEQRRRPSFADNPTLVGERVTLRPVTVDDAAAMIDLMDDAEVLRFTGTHPSRHGGGLAQAQEWYRTRADHDDRIDWAIVDRASDKYVGEAVLNDLDADNWSCSFRIALGSASFGRGFGTEATRMAVGHAFDAGLHRVSLEVYAFNPRALHVYEKVGFVHEGTLRQALRWDGDWIDAYVMAILAEDWPDPAG